MPSDEKLEYRYSIISIGMATTCADIRPQCNKISVVWPPQTGSPKKAFKIEEDIQLTKRQWPPQDNSTQIPTQKGCSHECHCDIKEHLGVCWKVMQLSD